MDDQSPLPGMEALVEQQREATAQREASSAGAGPDLTAPPRLRRADRAQVVMRPCSLDETLAATHLARELWWLVDKLGVTLFENTIRARGSTPGRAATDPRILLTLWIYATTDGVGSGREIDRLLTCHDAYRWIAGDVALNYHTICDFRVEHEKALDEWLTTMLVVLMQHGLIDPSRIIQDGLRVRASAGSDSFRSEEAARQLRDAAAAYVAQLKQQCDPSWSARQKAKRLADAQDRLSRLDRCLEELAKVKEVKENENNRKDRKDREPRASTTDPEARVMKMPGGGFRPAYNVQLACDGKGGAIVGVDVVNEGRDTGQSAPMRQQVEERTGVKVAEQLMDGGYVSLEEIDQAERDGVAVYAPVPEKKSKTKDPYDRKKDDTDATFAWRQRMATEEAKAIYKQRGSTIETINGDLAEHRQLRQFPVRGSPKVRCVGLLMAITFNFLRFRPALLTALREKC